MKKTGIILAISAFVLIIIGLVTILLVFITRPGLSFDLGEIADKDLELVNTVEIPLDGIGELDVTYYSDRITISESDGEALILEEYMNMDDPEMYGQVEKSGDSVEITGGERPRNHFLNGLRTSVRIYIPASYHGNLQVSSSSGSISSDTSLDMETISLKSNSGSIHMERPITAREIMLSASSGSINLEECSADTITGTVNSGSIRIRDADGLMKLTSTSGSIHTAGKGSGTFEASSGSVRLELTEVTGDLNLKCSSGSIRLKLPESAQFQLEADTNSGSIRTNFNDQLSFNEKKNHAEGSVGESPDIQIRLEASSGSVNVDRE